MAKLIRSDTAVGYTVSVSAGTSASQTADVEPSEFERFIAATKGLIRVTKTELDEKLGKS